MREVLRTTTPAIAMLIAAVSAGSMVMAPASATPGGAPAIPVNAEQETTGSTSTGHGFFSYAIDGDELCYTLSVSGLTQAPFGAHIHPGARGVAGPVAVPLATPPAATSSVSACLTASEDGAMTPAELTAIQADPKSFYVNVHTTSWPGGEIRGQLK